MGNFYSGQNWNRCGCIKQKSLIVLGFEKIDRPETNFFINFRVQIDTPPPNVSCNFNVCRWRCPIKLEKTHFSAIQKVCQYLSSKVWMPLPSFGHYLRGGHFSLIVFFFSFKIIWIKNYIISVGQMLYYHNRAILAVVGSREGSHINTLCIDEKSISKQIVWTGVSQTEVHSKQASKKLLSSTPDIVYFKSLGWSFRQKCKNGIQVPC